MTTKLVIVPAALLLAQVMGCGSSGDQSSSPTTGKSAGTTSPSKSSSTPAKSGSAGTGAMGTAGSGTTTPPKGSGTTMGAAGSAMMAQGSTPVTNGNMAYPDPRGACNIDSGFPSDDACILPPAEGEGLQIHVGPTDYTNPDEINKFIFHPGQEASACWTFHTTNDQKAYYQTFVMSGRAGTHHIINTMYKVEMTDGGFGMCADGGTGTNSNIIDNLPGASKAYMPRGTVAPENEHIARSIPPKVASQADMHYFNYTDKDILREFWMNIYFVPEAQVEQEGSQIRGMGGFAWSFAPIQPGTDMVYSYECPIDTDGRIMSLLGHYHSHGKQFTGSIKSANGDVQKVFEMYDYLDPATFQYDSITTNPAFSDSAAGAFSGILNVHKGDSLLWSCHVINDSMTALTYINNVMTGEMCNIWGSSIGPKLNCVLR
jgi:hypothetical protein